MGIFSFNSKVESGFPWNVLNSSEQLNDAFEKSFQHPVLFFKHSTRCSISSMAKSRFESNWSTGNELCTIYYLDLLTFRALSNEIEAKTGIIHQSPQVIVLKEGKVIYQDSHSGISASTIESLLNT